jgi:hypothetical protein
MVSPLIVVLCVLLVVGGLATGVFYVRKGGDSSSIPPSPSTGEQISKRDFEEINSMYKSRLRVLRGEVDSAIEHMQEKDDILNRLRRDREVCESLVKETSTVTSRVSEWETCAESSFREILRFSGEPLQSPAYSEEYNQAIHDGNMRIRAASDLGLKERRLVVSEVYANLNEMLEGMLASKDLSGREALDASSEKLRSVVGKFTDCAQELDLGQNELRALVGRHRAELTARGLKGVECESTVPPSENRSITVEEVRRFSDCVLRIIMGDILPGSLDPKREIGEMIDHLDTLIKTEQKTKRASISRANTINDRIVSTLSEQYEAVQGDRTVSKSIEMDIARQRERSSQMRDRIAQTDDRAREEADDRVRKRGSMNRLMNKSTDIDEAIADTESALERNRSLRRQIENDSDLNSTANQVQTELRSRGEIKELKKNLLEEFDSEANVLKEKRVTFTDQKEVASTLHNSLRKDEDRLKSALRDLKARRTKALPRHPPSHYTSGHDAVEENVQKLELLKRKVESRTLQRSPSIKTVVTPRPVPNANYDLSAIAKEHLPPLIELVNIVLKFFGQPELESVKEESLEALLERFDRPPFALQTHLKKTRRHPKDVPVFQMGYHIADARVLFTTKVASGAADNILPVVSLHLRASEPSRKILRNAFTGESRELSASKKSWSTPRFESNPSTAIRAYVDSELSEHIARANRTLRPPSMEGGGRADKLSPLLRFYVTRRVIPIYLLKAIRFVHHKRNWHRRDRYVVDYSVMIFLTIVLMGLRMDRLALVYIVDSLISMGVFAATKNRRALLMPYFLLPDLVIEVNDPSVY